MSTRDPFADVLTPVDAYMRVTGIRTRALARALGHSGEATLIGWTNGDHIPSVVDAWLVELVTKGAIPMPSWAGTGKGKALFSKRMAEMPEDVRRMLLTGQGKLNLKRDPSRDPSPREP